MEIKAKLVHVEPLKTQRNFMFSSRELLDGLVVNQMIGAEGFLLFSPDIISAEVKEAMKDKTIGVTGGFRPSQELRGELMKTWLADPKISMPFEQYYPLAMESIIKWVKERREKRLGV